MSRARSTLTVRRLGLWLIGVLAILVTGCESSLEVFVDVEDDGSGAVRVEVALDQEAAAGILDLDSVGFALADLDDAGWITEPPRVLESGGLRLAASKRFGTVEQFSDVIGEITGDAELFSEFELTRAKGFARVDYGITGEIMPRGLEVFGDDALVAALGRPLESLAARYGAAAPDVRIALQVNLPGDLRDLEDATGEPVANTSGAVRVWETTLVSPSNTEVILASTTQTVAALVWRGVAIVAAVLAGLVLLGQLLRVLRPQNRRGRGSGRNGKKPPTPKPRAKPKPIVTAEEAVVGDDVRSTPVVVALDGMGVIYREGNDIHEILIPFVREMGSDVTEDEIIARSRSLSLGRMTTADFWRAVRVDGDPNELDDLYLSRHQLNPGVIKFLRALRDQGVQVACITNDSTVWANKLRVRHSLEGLIDPWVMSGAVGVRKPDRPVYEVLRRVTGQPPNLIMVVDDDLVNLDAARDLGFRTAWFCPSADVSEANGHAILRSFEVSTPDAPAATPTAPAAP